MSEWKTWWELFRANSSKERYTKVAVPCVAETESLPPVPPRTGQSLATVKRALVNSKKSSLNNFYMDLYGSFYPSSSNWKVTDWLTFEAPSCGRISRQDQGPLCLGKSRGQCESIGKGVCTCLKSLFLGAYKELGKCQILKQVWTFLEYASSVSLIKLAGVPASCSSLESASVLCGCPAIQYGLSKALWFPCIDLRRVWQKQWYPLLHHLRTYTEIDSFNMWSHTYGRWSF